MLNSFTPTLGTTFTIINNEGGSAVSGTFAGLAEGAVFAAGGQLYKISYVGGDGNDVTLTSVPLTINEGPQTPSVTDGGTAYATGQLRRRTPLAATP